MRPANLKIILMSNGLAGGALLPATDHVGASLSMTSDVWGATATHSDRWPHTDWIYWTSLDYKLKRITGIFLLFSCFFLLGKYSVFAEGLWGMYFYFYFIMHVNKLIIKRICGAFLHYST